MPRYRIFNRLTHEKAEVDASVPAEACKVMGWPSEYCQIELLPAEDMSSMRDLRRTMKRDFSQEQIQFIVLMAILGALIGGIAGISSDIIVIGSLFGAFIGAALALILWGVLGPNATSVIKIVLVVGIAAAAIGCSSKCSLN